LAPLLFVPVVRQYGVSEEKGKAKPFTSWPGHKKEKKRKEGI
jgi:hypothetical protein